MSENKQAAPAEKTEIQSKKEHTVPLKKYLPATDIIETENELLIYMEMPGVDKERVKVKLEKNILEINGEIDSEVYEGFKALYTEYNIGNFSRQFELSNEVDQSKVEAKIEDGVLELIFPKVAEKQPRLIQVG